MPVQMHEIVPDKAMRVRPCRGVDDTEDIGNCQNTEMLPGAPKHQTIPQLGRLYTVRLHPKPVEFTQVSKRLSAVTGVYLARAMAIIPLATILRGRRDSD